MIKFEILKDRTQMGLVMPAKTHQTHIEALRTLLQGIYTEIKLPHDEAVSHGYRCIT